MSETISERWMIVELMGHQRMAGQVTEVTVAGKGMLRVDVPATDAHPAYSRLVSPEAVYALNPTTEDLAKHAAAAFRPRPVHDWELPRGLLPEAAVANGPEQPFPPDVVVCRECRREVSTDAERDRGVCRACALNERYEPVPTIFGDAGRDVSRRGCGRCGESLMSEADEAAGMCERCIEETRRLAEVSG